MACHFLREGKDERKQGQEMTYKASDDGSHVEDSPEPSKVMTLLMFMRIRDHDGSLSGPKHCCAYTKKYACNDVESSDVVFVVRIEQNANGVDAIANTTKS